MFGPKALLAKLGKNLVTSSVAGLSIKGLSILYVTLIAPLLTKDLLSYLKHPIVKVAILVVIAAVSSVDMVAGLLLSLAFLVSMLRLSKFEAKDELIKAMTKVIDVPQDVLNKIVDEAQDVTSAGLKKLGEVTGTSNVVDTVVDVADKVVDELQDVGNLAIDSLQKLTGFDSEVGSPVA